MSGPITTDHDHELLTKRQARFDERQGPRVGDYVDMLDGTLRRFTYAWPEGLQTTSGSQPGNASFHMDKEGYASFSGSLDRSIPFDRIEEKTSEILPGWIWFFSNEEPRAHNGVSGQMLFRVYREKAVSGAMPALLRAG